MSSNVDETMPAQPTVDDASVDDTAVAEPTGSDTHAAEPATGDEPAVADEAPAQEVDDAEVPEESDAAEESEAAAEPKAAAEPEARGPRTPVQRELPRLKQRYRSEIAPALNSEFGFSNVMQIPGLTKVVVNMGVGEAARDSKIIDHAIRDLTAITGQKPQVTKARKSIAQFKLREGMPIGCHVTLRGDRMWEFVDRLISTALPRIRDFRGMSPRQFDGQGNYTFGLSEQVVFHEIDQDRIDRLRGMDITFVTTATNDEEGRALLKHLGFPFKADADVVAKVRRNSGGRPIKGASKSANKALLKKKK